MTTPSEALDTNGSAEVFQQTVREWMDANAVIPDDIPIPAKGRPLSMELQKWALEFRRKLGAQGWIAPNWPREYGGGGLSNRHTAIIQEELARRRLPPLQVSIMHTAPLRIYGTEEQKRTLLASVLRGEITMAHAFNELAHGSDLSANTTGATRDGDDYVINGRKDYITSPMPPDLLLCLAITNPEAPPVYRYSVIAVDANTPGVLIKPENLLVPRREHRIFFADVHVPQTRVIGAEGQGIEIADMMVDLERGAISIPLDRQSEVELRERQARERLGE